MRTPPRLRGDRRRPARRRRDMPPESLSHVRTSARRAGPATPAAIPACRGGSRNARRNLMNRGDRDCHGFVRRFGGDTRFLYSPCVPTTREPGKVGVVLLQLGTPDAPTPEAL